MRFRILNILFCLCLASVFFTAPAQMARKTSRQTRHTVAAADSLRHVSDSVAMEIDTIWDFEPDSLILLENGKLNYDDWKVNSQEFSPDPTRAVWMSALLPGLGQVYNRRYWKLPIVVGGYLGLGYATNWNNTMLSDYTRAYRDIMDNDPDTKSYMNFFPPTVKESDLDKAWLTNVLQSRKNYFRRNRDLCLLSMIGVYLVAMVDAYVDASLSHFDISPDLSMDITPQLMLDPRGKNSSLALAWAFNF